VTITERTEWIVINGVAQQSDDVSTETTRTMPAWTQGPAALRRQWIAMVRRWWAEAKFQMAMLPTYWSRLAKQAPNGLWVGAKAWWAWTFDHQGRATLDAARSTFVDTRGDLVNLSRDHRQAIRAHAIADAVVLLFGLIAGLVTWLAAPWWLRLGIVAAVPGVLVPILGAVGRDPEAPPIVERWIGTGNVIPSITPDLVRIAFDAARIVGWGEATKGDRPDQALRLITPVQRNSADNGYAVTLALPTGITCEAAQRQIKELAVGLQRRAAAVRLAESEMEGAHAGLVDLVVIDNTLRDQAAKDWPWLEDEGPRSVYDPMPFGTDESGKPVVLPPLVGQHGVIAGQTGSGKTATALLIAMGIALDPIARLHLIDLKGNGDWFPLRHLADTFIDDPSAPGPVLACLQGIVDRIKARGDRLTEIMEALEVETEEAYRAGRPAPPNPFKDGAKVTRALALDPNEDLAPEFIILDELQTGFVDWPVADRKEFKRLVQIIVKKGRAAGTSFLGQTQQVTSETTPTSVTGSMGVRICLSVETYNESGQVLGWAAYRRGADASVLTVDDKGIAYLGGSAVPGPVRMVRTHYVTPHLEHLVRMAKRYRTEAGTLPTGQDDGPELTFLDRVVTVWPTGRDALQFAELGDLLAVEYPDACAGWGTRQVSAAAKAAGLRVGQEATQVKRTINGKTSNRRGVTLVDVLDTAAAEAIDRAGDNEGQDLDDDPDGEVAAG
jgi:S-DNA-T family DNA segregation ATPase FtsK/SpoIIIE